MAGFKLPSMCFNAQQAVRCCCSILLSVVPRKCSLLSRSPSATALPKTYSSLLLLPLSLAPVPAVSPRKGQDLPTKHIIHRSIE